MAPQDRLTTTLARAAPSTDASTAPLLHVAGLSVSYDAHRVVSGVDLTLGAGRSLALIGESGSGKSTIARAVLRLLPVAGRASGRVEIDGREVLGVPERRFRSLRGRTLGFVPQDPSRWCCGPTSSCSTTRPCRITETVWASCRTSERSWETKRR